jgi:pimeloyl-ACP methyl ester carboxylesterase
MGKFIDIDGIQTHYEEAGGGDPVVLLHSGEYGASAELSWEYTIPALAKHYRVIAPDWLGFGQTDKLFDFGGQRRRMINHMARFFEKLELRNAHFMGSSMGASMLLEIASRSPVPFPIRSVIASSGGGFVPFNDARKILVDYDGTAEAMTKIVGVMFFDPRWANDQAYVARRLKTSLAPGARRRHACACRAQLRLPTSAVPMTRLTRRSKCRRFWWPATPIRFVSRTMRRRWRHVSRTARSRSSSNVPTCRTLNMPGFSTNWLSIFSPDIEGPTRLFEGIMVR